MRIEAGCFCSHLFIFKNQVLMKRMFIFLVSFILFASQMVGQVCSGNITLSDQAAVDAFDCTSVTGSITITGSDITNLNGLSELISVGGSLLVIDNSSLINIGGLSSLTSVGGLRIGSNSSLTNIDGLSALISVGGLGIDDNSSLTNIDGLSGLTAVGSLGIIDNSSLTDIDGLSGITFVGGNLTIRGNLILTNIDGLSALTTIGDTGPFESLRIVNNSSLTDIDGLSSLTSIGEHLTIRGNLILTNIDGLSALTTIGGYFIIDNNDALTNINGLSALTFIEGYLDIINNATLTNIDGFSTLISVGGLLRFLLNDALTSINGFSELTSTGGSFIIVFNASLTNIDGLSTLTSVGGDLDIESNSQLSECCALSNLFDNGTIEGTITMENNSGNCNNDGADIINNCIGTQDLDNDGIPDAEDNCINTSNPNQTDEDNDGFGAACDCDDTPTTGSSCSTGCSTYYFDNDGDGFGVTTNTIVACTLPSNYATEDGDCDDTDPNVFPTASGNCGSIDDCGTSEGLLAYYPFDGGTTDISGNGHDLIPSGNPTPTTGVNGDSNGAFNFDGDEFFTPEGQEDFKFNNQSITFAAWVTIEDNASLYRTFLVNGNVASGSPQLWLAKSRIEIFEGRIFFQIANEFGQRFTALSILTGAALPKNQWMYVVGTLNMDTKKISLYIDGILQDETDLPSNFSYNFNAVNNSILEIGQYRWANNAFPNLGYEHKGNMDNVRIYDGALLNEEIEDNFECEIDETITPPCTITNDLTFTSQSQLDAFTETCTILDGNLIINGDDIADLSNLINLVEITGDVFIGDSTLNAVANDILTNLEGLNNIRKIGGNLFICNNPMLVSLSGFSSLEEVTGDIRVKNCVVLTSTIFVNLNFVGGDFFFSNLPLLFEFTFPDNLGSVGGSIYFGGTGIGIWGQNITGQNAGFFTIGGDLFLVDNPFLETVNLPDLINLGGCLHLINNTVLVGDVNLPNLQVIGEDLIIDNMDAILNLDIFEDLTTVNGNVVITNNDLLQNLDGLSNLLGVNDNFTMQNNPELTSCCGINPLLEFGNIGGQTNISNNPNGCSSTSNILDSCPLELTINCPTNIVLDCDAQIGGLDVSWGTPNAAANCNLGEDIDIIQTEGPSSGSVFTPGTTTVITYEATDDCGNVATCSFTVTLEEDEDCVCNPGSSCDDGDSCTEEDTYNEDCECLGTLVDGDMDGTCATEDCDDTDPTIPATPGSSCDDGDAATINDEIQSDGCTCMGTPETESCNINYTIDGFDVTVTGLTDAHISLKFHDIDAGWSIVYECFDDCNNPQVVSLPEGRYYLNLKMWDADWEVTCEETDLFEIGPNQCGNVTDGGTIGNEESFENPYDPEPIINIDAPSGGSGMIEYLWLSSTTGCPGIGDEIPNSNSPVYDPGPISETTYYLRCSRTVGCTTYYESNCLVKEVTGSNSVCDITHAYGPDYITLSGLDAAHADYQLFDSDWDLVNRCFNDCNTTETVSNLSEGTYFINAKLWDENWDIICTYTEYVTLDGTFSLLIQNQDYLIFNVVKNNQSVYLNWLTNVGNLNDHFLIERSTDNINFEVLKKVENEYGDQETQVYTIHDLQPEFGNNYYRIKEVFTNGAYRYSPTKKVHFDLDLLEVNVYPNPATGEVFLKMGDYTGQPAKIEIYNSLGVLMARENFDALPENEIRFVTTEFTSGVYAFYIYIENKKAINIPFVISRL